jgi:hypothetical protein
MESHGSSVGLLHLGHLVDRLPPHAHLSLCIWWYDEGGDGCAVLQVQQYSAGLHAFALSQLDEARHAVRVQPLTAPQGRLRSTWYNV